ncbi:5'-nucleotidase C-terminal domain-containing protein [Paenisporosarcina sp.]|uniref:5'-nucleotidase C-terminal domain-containing protein n=1 Tax=Paenisporosarcina sp. TaxID=1932001 RepID=UPI003C790718
MSNRRKSLQKFIATAATVTLVSSTLPIVTSASFTDVPSTLKAAVDYIVSENIAQGYNDTTFGTKNAIKRGDAAMMIAAALQLNVKSAPKSPFTDINARIEGAVNALYASKIISGKTATSFNPDSYMTRGEMSKALANAYKISGTASQNPFTDVNERWAPFVSALLEAGLTNGMSDTQFGTNLPVTRGEMASFVYRAKDLNNAADTEAPILSYAGASSIDVAHNSIFTLPIVTATDNHDAIVEISHKIRNSNGDLVAAINTANSGTYTITFSATDKAGNKAKELVITVNVAAQVIITPPVTPPVEPDPFTLSLMHTNDTHARLDNAAKRLTAIKEIRAAKPDALLLDAGDVFSGTLYFNQFQGEADLKFMNLAQYDLMTLGNHEFDLGSSPEGHQALANFIKDADFPIVSSNVDFSADANLKNLYNDSTGVDPTGGKMYNTIIKNMKGERVGFFGLTTEETDQISSANDVKFQDYIQSAKDAVNELERQGVNKIVAITHLGFDDNPAFDNDQLLAKHVDGIDVIVGGHSHTQLNTPAEVKVDENGVTKDLTIIVQAYQYGDFLGTLDVTFDKSGVITAHNGQLISTAGKAEDSEAKALLQPYADQIAIVKEELTGASSLVELSNPRLGQSSTESVRANETKLGNLIADGMLDKAKEYNSNVVIAMQNGGGIRAPIDAGPITVGEVLTTLPFGNTLATMTLSGTEIKAALEHSVSLVPGENGGFLHVAGMKFTYDSRLAAGNRVTLMKVENTDGSFTDINLASNYVIATNAFTAKGGDGYTVFKNVYEAGRVTDLGLSDWENLRDYIQKLGTVNPQIEGRILDDAKAPVGPSGPFEVTPGEFSGSAETPKTFIGDVIVTIENAELLQHTTVTGDLIIKGISATNLSFLNIQVEGNMDLSELDVKNVNLEGIQVDGDIIL